MTTILILSAGAGVAFLAVVVADALRRPGDERDPERPHRIEHVRAQSEAEAAGEVTEVDEAEAADLVAFVEAVATDEFPHIAFDVDPLTAPLPIGQDQEDAALFNGTVAAAWFSQAWPTGPTTPLSSVPLPTVPVADPHALEGPTAVWHRDWISQVLAGGPR